MSIAERTIIEGPAVISYDSFNYYTVDNIVLTPVLSLRQINSSYFGPVDQRITDKMFTVTFTPIGMMDDNAGKYFPFDASDLGSMIAPVADLPLYIYTAAGTKITLPAGVITQSPQLLLGVDKGPMGSMTITCIGDISKADAAADSAYIIATAAIAAHTLDPDDAPTPAYKATLSTTGDLDGNTGFTFDIGASITPRMVNRYGTVNFKLSAIAPVITFAPTYQTEATIMALWNFQGATAAKLGGSHKLGQSLTIAPADETQKGITIVFPDVLIKSGSMIFGAADPRHGDYAFVPAYSAGSDLYTITFPDLTPA